MTVDLYKLVVKGRSGEVCLFVRSPQTRILSPRLGRPTIGFIEGIDFYGAYTDEEGRVFGDLSKDIYVEWSRHSLGLDQIGDRIGGWKNLRVLRSEPYNRDLDTICVKCLNISSDE